MVCSYGSRFFRSLDLNMFRDTWKRPSFVSNSVGELIRFHRVRLRLYCRVTLGDPALQGQQGHQDKEFKDQRWVITFCPLCICKLCLRGKWETVHPCVWFRVNRDRRVWRGPEGCLEKASLDPKWVTMFVHRPVFLCVCVCFMCFNHTYFAMCDRVTMARWGRGGWRESKEILETLEPRGSQWVTLMMILFVYLLWWSNTRFERCRQFHFSKHLSANGIQNVQLCSHFHNNITVVSF